MLISLLRDFNIRYPQYELLGLDIHGTVCTLTPDNWDWILSIRLNHNKIESICIPSDVQDKMEEL